MELKNLKDLELNEKIKTLAAQERKLTQDILWHIAEVDRRKLYLHKAYSSLFEYLVKEIGYSAGAAQRRIDAARLLQRVPEVSHQIETGNINLCQVSKLQKICRQLKKETGQVVQVEVQKDILQKLENKNSAQTDLILAHEFNIEIKSDEKTFMQRDESVRVELTFTKKEMELIKTAQNLLSNKTGGTLKETLLEMAQRTVKTQKPKERAELATATVAVKPELKSVTPKLKKEILHRDQFCQFKDAKTGKICGSKRFLEVDHIHPLFAQGKNTPENLRVLCKSHNIFRYRAGL